MRARFNGEEREVGFNNLVGFVADEVVLTREDVDRLVDMFHTGAGEAAFYPWLMQLRGRLTSDRRKRKGADFMEVYGAGEVKIGLTVGEYQPGTVTGRFSRRHPPFEDLSDVREQRPRPNVESLINTDFSEIERRVLGWMPEYVERTYQLRTHDDRVLTTWNTVGEPLPEYAPLVEAADTAQRFTIERDGEIHMGCYIVKLLC